MSFWRSGGRDTDFDDYDPTPYSGGYDIALTYGRPIPPSEETCYPVSVAGDIDYQRPNFFSGSQMSVYEAHNASRTGDCYGLLPPGQVPKPQPAYDFQPPPPPAFYSHPQPQPPYGPSGEYGSVYGGSPQHQEYGSGYDGGRQRRDEGFESRPQYGSGYGSGYGQKEQSYGFGHEVPARLGGEYGSGYRRNDDEGYGRQGYGGSEYRRSEGGGYEGGGVGYGRSDNYGYGGKTSYVGDEESGRYGILGYGEESARYKMPSYRDEDASGVYSQPSYYGGLEEQGYGRGKYGDHPDEKKKNSDSDDEKKKHRHHKHHHHRN
ncbi:Uncharacterized protein AXF42_Ash016618 [Apostasia shenzhenica]|uniref:Uncharacterized protein n=1 Tax=Apostasia shenzhenica TaxID=1088818 RepID=A0A2I0A1L0_9ASPA|nr:Uncharacterized protein AXF42_Ash016618 [Apostasia shenzhenica]